MNNTVVTVIIIAIVIVVGLPIVASLAKGGDKFAGSVWAGALVPGTEVEVQYEFREDGVMKMSISNAEKLNANLGASVTEAEGTWRMEGNVVICTPVEAGPSVTFTLRDGQLYDAMNTALRRVK